MNYSTNKGQRYSYFLDDLRYAAYF
jgi:hypothetical protein